MLLGAVAGALLQGYLGITAFVINGLLVFALAASSLAIPRRWQRNYMPR